MAPTSARIGAQAPDRNSPLPLWAQVCTDLRRRIEANEFEAGFPGELSLTEEYEVSRHTIREALRVLRGEGILRSERGRATTVEAPKYQQRLGTLYSLFTTMESQGVTQRSEVRRLARTTNASIAANLGLAPTTPLVVLERIRFADDEPLALDTSWLPESIAGPLLDADFTSVGLYAELSRLCNVVIDSGSERVTAQLTPRHIANLLTIPDTSAVFYIERKASALSAPAEWRETYIRGDRFSLESLWTPTTSSITASTDTATEESI
jgi:GntR family transcriptional regulator